LVVPADGADGPQRQHGCAAQQGVDGAHAEDRRRPDRHQQSELRITRPPELRYISIA